MEQLVRVRNVFPDGTAEVLLVRESACSGDCHKCSGCGAAKETILIDAYNGINARTGDLVVVKSETGPVMKAVGVFYALPLVLFFLGYYLGATLWNRGALAGSLGFVLAICLAVVYDRKVAKQDKSTYTITGYAGDHLLQALKKGDNTVD